MSKLDLNPFCLLQFVDGIESYPPRAATAAFPQAQQPVSSVRAPTGGR